MKFRIGSTTGTVAVVIFFALFSLSCTNVDKVEDWYQEQDKARREQFPTMTTCDRNEQNYWRYIAEVEEVSDNYQRAIVAVAQSGNPTGAQSLASELGQYTQVRSATFMRAAGWSEETYYICGFWLRAKRNPETTCSAEGEFPAHALGYGHYGSLRYCIENSIPPF